MLMSFDSIQTGLWAFCYPPWILHVNCSAHRVVISSVLFVCYHWCDHLQIRLLEAGNDGPTQSVWEGQESCENYRHSKCSVRKQELFGLKQELFNKKHELWSSIKKDYHRLYFIVFLNWKWFIDISIVIDWIYIISIPILSIYFNVLF